MSAAHLILQRMRENWCHQVPRPSVWEPTPSRPPSSGFTSELLAQAIADAKAVRATALANARAAMEEAFKNKK